MKIGDLCVDEKRFFVRKKLWFDLHLFIGEIRVLQCFVNLIQFWIFICRNLINLEMGCCFAALKIEFMKKRRWSWQLKSSLWFCLGGCNCNFPKKSCARNVHQRTKSLKLLHARSNDSYTIVGNPKIEMYLMHAAFQFKCFVKSVSQSQEKLQMISSKYLYSCCKRTWWYFTTKLIKIHDSFELVEKVFLNGTFSVIRFRVLIWSN